MEDFEDEESLEAATVEDRLMQEGEARAVRLERMRQEEYMREQESNSSLEINAVSRQLQQGMQREAGVTANAVTPPAVTPAFDQLQPRARRRSTEGRSRRRWLPPQRR